MSPLHCETSNLEESVLYFANNKIENMEGIFP